LKIRAAVRNEERALPLKQHGAEIVQIDVSKPQTLDKALEGAERLLIVAPFSEENLIVNNAWVDAAKRANIKFIVRMGGYKSDRRGTPMADWHDDGEKYLVQSGIPYVFIRSLFLMSNWLSQANTIKTRGIFYQRFGYGKCPFVDPRDLGEVAAKVFSSQDVNQYGKVLTVAGPQMMTCYEVAHAFAKVLRREVRYMENAEAQAYDAMISTGTPELLAKGLIKLGFLFQAGYYEDISSSSFTEILHKHPHTFQQYIHHNVTTFQ